MRGHLIGVLLLVAAVSGCQAGVPSLEQVAVKYVGSDTTLPQRVGATVVLDRQGHDELRQVCREQGIGYWRIYNVFTVSRPAIEATDQTLIAEDGTPPKGRMARRGFYSPAWEPMRQAKIDAIVEDVTRTRPAGISLDMVRWYMENHTEALSRGKAWEWESVAPDGARASLLSFSFDPATLRRFQSERGVALRADVADGKAAAREILAEYREAWVAWKASLVSQTVAEIREAVHAVDPSIQIMVQLVPWRIEEYDGAIVEVLGQDPRRLRAHADVFSPMTYHALLGRPATWVGAYGNWLREETGTAVWPCIQAMGHGNKDRTPFTPAEVAAAWGAVEAAGLAGIAIYGPRSRDEAVVNALAARRE